MWYVLQTITGKEEELVQMIHKIVSPTCYSKCFTAYYERIWRKQQRSIVHVERLFPGYVFILTEQPETLFLQLKRVPAMSKLIADGEYTFLALNTAEEIYMRNLLGESRDYIAHLSYVETDGKGHVGYISGPLSHYKNQVVRFQFKKRYAIVKLELLGESKTVALGIILKEDVQQEIAYGKVETRQELSQVYQAPMVGTKEEILEIKEGEQIKIVSGIFAGVTGFVWRVSKRTVEVGIQMFGQEIAVEISLDDVCRME